jgi:integrase
MTVGGPHHTRLRLNEIPRPDLRHSFASLLLAQGRIHTYVARQMGPSTTVLINTYEYLIEEYGGGTRIDLRPKPPRHARSGLPCDCPRAVSRPAP